MQKIITSFYICLSANLMSQQAQLKPYDLLITEIMADPSPNLGYLPNDEYFELYNNSSNAIDLSLVTVSVGTRTYSPPDTILAPNEYIAFFDTPTLKNSGDSVIILFNEKPIHRVDYLPSWIDDGFKANGGWSLEIIDLNKPCLGKVNWAASASPEGGTPNFENSIISEINTENINIENWFTKGDSAVVIKFNLSIKSIEATSNYHINYDEVTLNMPISTTPQSTLISNATTCFKANFSDTILIIQQPELPTRGDLVINEVLFNPTSTGHDYLEVYNISSKAIDLSKVLFSEYDAAGDLKPGTGLSSEPYVILPGAFAVICPNINWLSNKYGSKTNFIQNQLPNLNNNEDEVLLITTNGAVIDALTYTSNWHHYTINDEKGKALEKIIAVNDNIASNWTTASFSQNYGTPGRINSQSPNKSSTSTNSFSIANNVITPNGDGIQDYLIINTNLQTPNQLVSITIFDSKGFELKKLLEQNTIGPNEVITWDGLLDNGNHLSAGTYVVFCNVFNANTNETKVEKMIFYINQPW